MIRDMRPADEAAPTRHRDLYIEVNGARLRYRDEGHGPAVIFVHGWALDLDMWAPQAALVGGEFDLDSRSPCDLIGPSMRYIQ